MTNAILMDQNYSFKLYVIRINGQENFIALTVEIPNLIYGRKIIVSQKKSNSQILGYHFYRIGPTNTYF
jgi:hypothetical protein